MEIQSQVVSSSKDLNTKVREICSTFQGQVRNPQDDVIFFDDLSVGYPNGSKYSASDYRKKCQQIIKAKLQDRSSRFGNQFWTTEQLETIRATVNRQKIPILFGVRNSAPLFLGLEWFYDQKSNQPIPGIYISLDVGEDFLNIPKPELEKMVHAQAEFIEFEYPILQKYMPELANPTLNIYSLISYTELEAWKKRFNHEELYLNLVLRFADKFCDSHEKRMLLEGAVDLATLEKRVERIYRVKRIQGFIKMYREQLAPSARHAFDLQSQYFIGNLTEQSPQELQDLEYVLQLVLEDGRYIDSNPKSEQYLKQAYSDSFYLNKHHYPKSRFYQARWGGNQIDYMFLLFMVEKKLSGIWNDFIDPQKNPNLEVRQIEKFSNGQYRVWQSNSKHQDFALHSTVSPECLQWMQMLVAAAQRLHHPDQPKVRLESDTRLTKFNEDHVIRVKYQIGKGIRGSDAWRSEVEVFNKGSHLKTLIDQRGNHKADILLQSTGPCAANQIEALKYSREHRSIKYREFKNCRQDSEEIERHLPEFNALTLNGHSRIWNTSQISTNKMVLWNPYFVDGQLVYDFDIYAFSEPYRVKVFLKAQASLPLSSGEIEKIELHIQEKTQGPKIIYEYPNDIFGSVEIKDLVDKVIRWINQ